MWLRLRQIALVAEALEPLEKQLADIFSIQACHRDPAVAEFGLSNVLFPLGNQFLEIVAPQRPGTAAQRYLDRRGGDGGYMVITQCDDHPARRARVDALGVRIAHEFKAPGFVNMQLHPRDTGGTFFEIDQQLGPDGNNVDGAWVPAGEGWRRFVDTSRVSAIAEAEIQCSDPQQVAARWSEIAEIPARAREHGYALELDNARILFVPCDDGRPEGLGGLTLVCTNPGAALEAARHLGLAVAADRFELGGMRWRLVAP